MNPPTPGLAELRIDRGEDGEDPRRRGWIVVLILVAALGALGAYRWWQTRIPEVRLHTLVAPASASGRAVLNASGYVVARREATVSSKVTGKVVEVLFEEGVHVEAGQVLARLDDANLKASLRFAEAELAAANAAQAEIRARLDEAEKNLRRVRELSASRVASEADLDRVEAEVLSLRARLERQQADITVAERGVARWQQELDDTIIRAPFTGVATAKNAQPGEMISPMSAGGGFTRTGIGTIVDMNSLEIEVDVNESFINRVHAGQAVLATLDAYPDWRIPAQVIAIIPTADRQKATVRVRVAFEQLDPRMLPQMGVKVAFQAGPTDTAGAQIVTVPTTALLTEDGHDYVWRFRNGQVERVKVRVGSRRPDEAVVNEGLSPGDQVVVDPAPDLREGSPVRAQRR